MTDEQTLAERVVAQMMARDAFSQWLGIEIVNVRPRGASVRLTVRDDMVNGFGVCHGGVTFALASLIPQNMLQQDGVNGCAWIANGLGVPVVAAIPKSDILRVVKRIGTGLQTSG